MNFDKIKKNIIDFGKKAGEQVKSLCSKIADLAKGIYAKLGLQKTIGLCASSLMLITSIVLLCLVLRMAFFPGIYVALVFIILVLLAVLFYTLQHWKTAGWVGSALAIIMSVVFIIGSGYIHKITSTVKEISGVKTQIDHYSMYVLAGDKAEKTADTNNYKCGVLKDVEAENIQSVFESIKDAKYEVVEYEGLMDLFTALREGGVQAVLANISYVGALGNLDGFEGIEDELKVVYEKQIESEVKEQTPTPSPTVTSTPTPEPTATPTPEGWTQDPNVTLTPTPSPTETPTPTPDPMVVWRDLIVPEDQYIKGNKNIFTVYVSGIDVFGEPNINRNSDCNILVTVNMNTGQILLVNTPRDYYVPLATKGEMDKLTHSGCYGVTESLKTLEQLYGVQIDYYARVNFTSTMDLIDTLGGIEVYSEYSFVAGQSGGVYSFEKGYNHLTGDSAIHFMRERYAFIDGDRQRGKNQMAVIMGIIDKLTSTDALLNFNQLFDQLSKSIKTNMPYDRIAEIVRFQLNNMPDWKFTQASVNGYDAFDYCFALKGRAYVMYSDINSVKNVREKIKNVYNGK